ncbi:hypothetical protein M0R45_000794 [Rubus argutus]|uniref:Uncharacterized protein n=1 Tax=Rubus argutus TaxID=59490 RepID=A0AAW1VNC1_RUBAR
MLIGNSGQSLPLSAHAPETSSLIPFAPKRLPKSHPCPLWSSSFTFCSLSTKLSRRNPLPQDFDFPPFDVVHASHVRPGIRALLKKLESDLEELGAHGGADLAKAGAVKDSSELRSAIEEVQPEKLKAK